MQLVTLICHRDVELGIKCLGSLLRCYPGNDGLALLDDGSLTREDATRLEANLPGATVRLRWERETEVRERLVQYPNSARYREAQPLGLKLFDPLVLFPQGFLFVDSDIAFFRPIDLRQIERAAKTGFVFMEDEREGYSGRATDFVYKHRLPIYSKINSGIFSFASSLFDFDFAEWFLGVPEFQVFPHLLEQTCWSALASKHPTWTIDKAQVRCATPKIELDSATAAIHFIFPHKARVDSYLPIHLESESDAVGLQLHEARRLTFARIAVNTLANRMPGWLSRFAP